jgi:hypothetical protein
MSAADMVQALDAPYTRPAELAAFDQPANDPGPVRRFYWAKEARSFAPPQWLIRGLLPQNTLVLLYGESSSGKTTLAVDLGLRIATAMKVHDSPCQKGAVLHVAGEDEVGLRQRVEAFCRRHEVQDPSYAILPGRLDLADDRSVDALIADIQAASTERGEPVVLVIIDTLARCASIDENSSREMGEVVTQCDRVKRETGAAVLIIHHSGKEEKKGARGSSALRAAVDSEIQVLSKDGSRGLWVTKQRNGRAQFGWHFKLQEIEVWRDGESGHTESACTVEHLEKSEGKLNFGKATGKAKRLGRNQQKLRDVLEKAYREGVESWDRDELGQLARVALPRAARSTIKSAIDGMMTHGVLSQSTDRLYLVKPPTRAAQPVRTEAQAQPVSHVAQDANVRCDNAESESGVAASAKPTTLHYGTEP